ncbi:flagellar hook-length control protein FliK [Pseudooceanicola onchidii]|uniref:flagellar hook-length control protein FliK n=1 Tax=Pseudooceanicola onchidii TaxID=2562279 RepID=UPI00145B4049|nr:flagellar hook-length control protein FliK [Pseudooceanicola onchidii]
MPSRITSPAPTASKPLFSDTPRVQPVAADVEGAPAAATSQVMTVKHAPAPITMTTATDRVTMVRSEVDQPPAKAETHGAAVSAEVRDQRSDHTAQSANRETLPSQKQEATHPTTSPLVPAEPQLRRPVAAADRAKLAPRKEIPEDAAKTIPSNDTQRQAKAMSTVFPLNAPQPTAGNAVSPEVPFELTIADQPDLHPDAIRETSHGTTSHAAPRPSMAPQSDLAARVADQVAQVARHLPGGPVEIALSPEELGRVRMQLTTSDTGLTLMITAERPETLDLMRKNIDLLADQYRDLGYGTLDFAFGQETADQRGSGGGGNPFGDTPANEPVEQVQRSVLKTAKSGMDIRI